MRRDRTETEREMDRSGASLEGNRPRVGERRMRGGEGDRNLLEGLAGGGRRSPDWTEVERRERAASTVEAGQARGWKSKGALEDRVEAGRGSVGSQQVDRGGRIKQRGKAQGAGHGGNMEHTDRRRRSQRNQ